MRPFFIEWFSCFGKKQICMDGEQMGELALIICNPYMKINKRKSRFFIWLFLKIKLKDPWKKENKKRLFAGLHPVVMLAGMAAWKQVFRIHADNPDRTACRTISLKSPPLRCGEKTHCVLEKKPSGWRAGPAVTTQDASSPLNHRCMPWCYTA